MSVQLVIMEPQTKCTFGIKNHNKAHKEPHKEQHKEPQKGLQIYYSPTLNKKPSAIPEN